VRALRTYQAIPLLDEIKGGMEVTLSQISGKSSLAKALRYPLARWEALTRYTTDGRLEVCNNAAERAIRPLAIGRKNWLFAGSDGSGERAALIYTLTETAKLNGLDPEAYLRTVIARIADRRSTAWANCCPGASKTRLPRQHLHTIADTHSCASARNAQQADHRSAVNIARPAGTTSTELLGHDRLQLY